MIPRIAAGYNAPAGLSIVGVATKVLGTAPITVAIPTGAVAGNLLVAVVVSHDAIITPSITFTTFSTALLGATGYNIILYRVMDGTEGASFTIANQYGSYCDVICFAVANQNTATPLSGFVAGGSSYVTNPTVPATNTTILNSMWVQVGAESTGMSSTLLGGNPTYSSIIGELTDNTNIGQLGVYYKMVSGIGSTGTATITFPSANTAQANSFVINAIAYTNYSANPSFDSGSYSNTGFPVRASSSKTFADAVSETSSYAVAMGIVKSFKPNIGATTSYIDAIARSRKVVSSVSQTTAYLVAAGIVKSFGFPLSEANAFTTNLTVTLLSVGPVTFTFGISEAQSFTDALQRSRAAATSFSEATVQAVTIARSRGVSSSYSEAMSDSSTVGRKRNVAETIAEIESFSDAISRVRNVVNSITEAESTALTHSRTRGILTALNEVNSIATNAIRTRSIVNVIAQNDTTTLTVGRVRKAVVALAESLSDILALNRNKSISATIAESELIQIAINVATVAVKLFAAAIAQNQTFVETVKRSRNVSTAYSEAETINNLTNARIRGVSESITQVTGDALAIGRARIVNPNINEIELMQESLRRLRSAVVGVSEHQTQNAVLARLLKLISAYGSVITESFSIISVGQEGGFYTVVSWDEWVTTPTGQQLITNSIEI